MDIFEWVLRENESVLAVIRRRSNNTELLIVYVLLSLFIKKPQLLGAFFVSCLLFEWSLFDSLKEYQLYLITFLIYSYVITNRVFSAKTNLACALMCFLCLLFACDAALYGLNGIYGESETIVYKNIERLFVCSHSLIIASFVDIKRIENGLRNVTGIIRSMSANSAYIVIM